MNGKTRALASILALVMSIILILYGAYRKEVDTVFAKSIRICLECIGIG